MQALGSAQQRWSGRGGGEGKGHRKTEKVLCTPALEAWNENH